MKYIPKNGRLIVEPITEKENEKHEKTKGGIYLPIELAESETTTKEYQVVSYCNSLDDVDIQVGTKVVVRKEIGLKLGTKENKQRIIRYEDILAVY